MVAGSQEYYLRTVAAGRKQYYTGSGEAPGYWLSQGARLLELDERWRQPTCGPSSAESRPTARSSPPGGWPRPTGWPASTSRSRLPSPSPSSMDWGAEVSATVRAAHAVAVAEVLGYLERHALRLRRDAGGERRIEGNGLAAAAFLHWTSRAGDPQLHTHVLGPTWPKEEMAHGRLPTSDCSTTTPAPPASSIPFVRLYVRDRRVDTFPARLSLGHAGGRTPAGCVSWCPASRRPSSGGTGRCEC